MSEMTSLDRVQTAMSFEEPDRVPYILPLNLHGTKLFNLSIEEYYSKPEKVVEAQLHFKQKYGSDALMGYLYSGQEMDAWGMDIIFFEDGPPNAGKPFINNREQIESLETPNPTDSKILQDVLKVIELYFNKVGDTTPIFGVATSPFSLPIMQMGFNKYIELIYENRDLFWELMKINEQFCIEWANIQIENGATAIALSDPMSSPMIIPRELFRETGYKVIQRIKKKINGDIAFHPASARTQGILEDIIELGFIGVAVSALDDLSEVKNICKENLTIMGNLDGIKMCDWTSEIAEKEVKNTIKKAGLGGGFVLTDHHGEIPLQVPEYIISSIADTAKKWGKYPLDWVE